MGVQKLRELREALKTAHQETKEVADDWSDSIRDSLCTDEVAKPDKRFEIWDTMARVHKAARDAARILHAALTREGDSEEIKRVKNLVDFHDANVTVCETFVKTGNMESPDIISAKDTILRLTGEK